MIKIITVIDSLRGIVEQHNQDIDSYIARYTSGARVIYVENSCLESLVVDYDTKTDIESSSGSDEPVWVLGGSEVLKFAIKYAVEIHIIQVNGIMECSESFPSFESTFHIHRRRPIRKQGGIIYQFQIWRPGRLLENNMIDYNSEHNY